MPQSRHGPDEGAAGGPPFRYIAPALQSTMRHDPITRSRRQIRGFLRNRTTPWACLLLVAVAWLGAGPARAEPLPVVRIGVLKFGTVNWELDVIRRHGLDRRKQLPAERGRGPQELPGHGDAERAPTGREVHDRGNPVIGVWGPPKPGVDHLLGGSPGP